MCNLVGGKRTNNLLYETRRCFVFRGTVISGDAGPSLVHCSTVSAVL